MPQADEKNSTRIVILILSTLGFALSLYLTYIHYSEAEALFCTSGSGCDTVRESPYAVILGVPVSLLGAIGYSLIFVLSFISNNRRDKWFLLYLFTLAGFVFSTYLTYIELFVLKAVCFYCVISAVIITAILVILVLKRPVGTASISFSKAATLSVLVLGAVLIGSFLLQSNELRAGSDNSFQVGLAKHLGETGATMYGSFQCPHCTTQKLLFGKNAFKYIKYVECHPRGENANTVLCQQKLVHSYPTWEIKGQFYVGAKSLQELAKISEYKPNGTVK
ncbi:MAG: vitamin K epoxide reductase family protein [Thermodesulfobacteriota bacterium]